MTKTNETTIVSTKANSIDIRDYMPQILAISKHTLKFSISNQEELSDLLDVMFGQRLTNTNDNISLGFCDNKNYSSRIQLRHNGKCYTIYSNVSDNKLRQNLAK